MVLRLARGHSNSRKSNLLGAEGVTKHANCVEVSLCDLFDNRVLYEQQTQKKAWFYLLSIYSCQDICIV